MKWAVRKLVSSRSRRLLMRRLRIPLTLRGGVKINSHRIHSQWIVNSLINGRYEIEESSSLDALIQPDDRILELGSGLGYVACLAAKKAHRGHRAAGSTFSVCKTSPASSMVAGFFASNFAEKTVHVSTL